MNTRHPLDAWTRQRRVASRFEHGLAKWSNGCRLRSDLYGKSVIAYMGREQKAVQVAIGIVTRASSSDVSKRFGFYYDEAMTHPVVVERNGAACVVMMPAAEHERLARLDHVALHPRELAEADLKALRDVVIPGRARGLDHLLD